MDSFNKKALVFKAAAASDGDYLLADMQNYYAATISVGWTGATASDSVVTFIQRDKTTSAWKELVGLNYTLNTATGSQDLFCGNFGSRYVGVRISKNSETTAVITVNISGKSN